MLEGNITIIYNGKINKIGTAALFWIIFIYQLLEWVVCYIIIQLFYKAIKYQLRNFDVR